MRPPKMPNGVIAIPLGGFVQQISVFGFFAVATIGVVAQTLWFFFARIVMPNRCTVRGIDKTHSNFCSFFAFFGSLLMG